MIHSCSYVCVHWFTLSQHKFNNIQRQRPCMLQVTTSKWSYPWQNAQHCSALYFRERQGSKTILQPILQFTGIKISSHLTKQVSSGIILRLNMNKIYLHIQTNMSELMSGGTLFKCGQCLLCLRLDTYNITSWCRRSLQQSVASVTSVSVNCVHRCQRLAGAVKRHNKLGTAGPLANRLHTASTTWPLHSSQLAHTFLLHHWLHVVWSAPKHRST